MAVSREEYLKRYLCGPTEKEKKIKKKASKAVTKKAGLKILDDDVDFNSLLPSNIQNSLDDDLADDNPVVVDLGLDDRPKQLKELERMRNSKRWKMVAQDEDDTENLAASKVGEIKKEREATINSSEHSNSKHPGYRDKGKKRYDSESDSSPSRTADDQCTSFSRNRPRADSESGASPVNVAQLKRNGFENETLTGKTRRKDINCGSDNSPPRQNQGSTGSSYNSRKRRRQNSTGFGDNSPPRQMEGRRASFDNSPPRRKRTDSSDSADNSPPRQRRSERTNVDNSPLRRKIARRDSDSDISPPRKEDKSAMDGSRQELKKDRTDQTEDATNYKVIYRKDGKKRDLEAEKKSKEEEEAKKAAMAAKYKEWNKGLKQKEMANDRIADALHEAEKPFARYKDDDDLDSRLRAQLLAEDPMLAFIKKKKSKATGVEKPRYRGPQPPPNRFNLEPGYRWDGVDRSNGFEKKFFTKLSEDKAKKDMAYKWSVEDM